MKVGWLRGRDVAVQVGMDRFRIGLASVEGRNCLIDALRQVLCRDLGCDAFATRGLVEHEFRGLSPGDFLDLREQQSSPAACHSTIIAGSISPQPISKLFAWICCMLEMARLSERCPTSCTSPGKLFFILYLRSLQCLPVGWRALRRFQRVPELKASHVSRARKKSHVAQLQHLPADWWVVRRFQGVCQLMLLHAAFFTALSGSTQSSVGLRVPDVTFYKCAQEMFSGSIQATGWHRERDACIPISGQYYQTVDVCDFSAGSLIDALRQVVGDGCVCDMQGIHSLNVGGLPGVGPACNWDLVQHGEVVPFWLSELARDADTRLEPDEFSILCVDLVTLGRTTIVGEGPDTLPIGRGNANGFLPLLLAASSNGFAGFTQVWESLRIKDVTAEFTERGSVDAFSPWHRQWGI